LRLRMAGFWARKGLAHTEKCRKKVDAMSESVRHQGEAVVKDRGQGLSRNQRTRLLKGKSTHDESALLRPYPKKWWIPIIFGAVEAEDSDEKSTIAANLERFLTHEERVKKVVGIQLSSLDPAISLDRTQKPGPHRIQNIMAALG
jgi:hypothetical protein